MIFKSLNAFKTLEPTQVLVLKKKKQQRLMHTVAPLHQF